MTALVRLIIGSLLLTALAVPIASATDCTMSEPWWTPVQTPDQDVSVDYPLNRVYVVEATDEEAIEASPFWTLDAPAHALVELWLETNRLPGLQKEATACPDGSQVAADEQAASQEADATPAIDLVNEAYATTDPAGAANTAVGAYDSVAFAASGASATDCARPPAWWTPVGTWDDSIQEVSVWFPTEPVYVRWDTDNEPIVAPPFLEGGTITSFHIEIWRETNGLSGLQNETTTCPDGSQVAADEQMASQDGDAAPVIGVVNDAYATADPVGAVNTVADAYYAAVDQVKTAYAEALMAAGDAYGSVGSLYAETWATLIAVAIEALMGGGPTGPAYDAASETWNLVLVPLVPGPVDDEVNSCGPNADFCI